MTLSSCGCKGSESVNVALRTCSRREASLLLPPSEYLALRVSQLSFTVWQGYMHCCPTFLSAEIMVSWVSWSLRYHSL